jgi:hypothetical protein
MARQRRFGRVNLVLQLIANSIAIQSNFELDRFRCDIVQLTEQGASRPLLRSVEGNSSEATPPSPPIQQSVLDTVGNDQQVILGVGLSGKSHWSSSMHWDQRESQFVVDVACRCNEAVTWLGSTFDLQAGVDATVEGDTIQLTLDGNRIATIVPMFNCSAQLESGRITLRPIVVDHAKLPATVRWQFAIRHKP